MDYELRDIRMYNGFLRTVEAEKDGVLYHLYNVGFDGTLYIISAYVKASFDGILGEDYSTITHMFGSLYGQLGSKRTPTEEDPTKEEIQELLKNFYIWLFTLDDPQMVEFKERVKEVRGDPEYNELQIVCRKP